jgi:3-oxoacyl-[acyl-carrier-protein] synthase III
LAEGKIKRGDLVVFAAVGAGFSAGATLVRWSFSPTPAKTPPS